MDSDADLISVDEPVEKKPEERNGYNIELVDIIHPLKYMIDFRKNMVTEDGRKKEDVMDLMKYIEKFIIKKIVAVNDLDNNMLLSGDELMPIFEEYLEIILSNQEKDLIDDFFKNHFNRSEINSKEFFTFITHKMYVDKNGTPCKRDEIMTEKMIKWCENIFLEKIKPLVTSETVVTYDMILKFFSRYMTENEYKIEKIYLRTLKLKLDSYEKFSH